MSAATVSINKKWPDGTLISIGGTDADDFLTNVKALLGEDTAVLAEFERAFTAAAANVIAEAENVVRGAFPDAAPPPPTQASRRPAGPPPGQNAPVCEHGYAREYKQGTNGAGKAWKAWMCPLRRDEGACAPQWVR